MENHKEQHDGALLEKELRSQPMNYTEIAKALPSNRKTLYNWFNKPELPQDTIRKISTVIGVDLIAKYPGQWTGDRPYQANIAERVRNLNESSVDFWKEKYYDILSKYNSMLEEKLNSKK